jgi:hypothetical protein
VTLTATNARGTDDEVKTEIFGSMSRSAFTAKVTSGKTLTSSSLTSRPATPRPGPGPLGTEGRPQPRTRSTPTRRPG